MDATQPIRLEYQVVIAIAVGCLASLTGLAWPLAILTGIVIARDAADRRHGVPVPFMARVIRLLAVTGGVLGILLAGAPAATTLSIATVALSVGPLIGSFLIVWLSVVSEGMTSDAPSTDRLIVRLLLFAGGFLGFTVLGTFSNASLALSLWPA